MKKNLLWFFSLVLMATTLTITNYSCSTDDCADVDCGIGGDCFEGDCICKVGFVKDSAGNCVEACSLVTCSDNSTCVDGTCVCDAGYEMDASGNCVVEADKYLGSWTVADDCSASGSASYTVTINAGVTGDQVHIVNFWNVFVNSINATITGNSLVIERQEPDNDKFFVVGTGTYNSDGTITLSYTVSDETDSNNIMSDTCASTLTK